MTTKKELQAERLALTTDYIDEVFGLLADVLPPVYLQQYCTLRKMWVQEDNNILARLEELSVNQETKKENKQ